MLTPTITVVIALALIIVFIYCAFSIYAIYLFLNSRPTEELRKKVQTKGGLMIIIHSGCLYGAASILRGLNFGPTIEYIKLKLLPALVEIGLFETIWSTLFVVLAWILPFATAAVGTNLITQALCQRTGNESYEAEINRQHKQLRKLIRGKFEKYKRWSPGNSDSTAARKASMRGYETY